MDNQVVTFGCRLNAYESEAIKKAVGQSGEKNLIVFNSCAVTSQAEQQLRQAVRKARRENPDAKIVVTGCAAQIDPERYAKMDEVDLVLGNQEKSRVESYLGEGDLVQKNSASLLENGDLARKNDDLLAENTASLLENGDVAQNSSQNLQNIGKFAQKSLSNQESARHETVRQESLNQESAHQDKIFLENKARNKSFLEPTQAAKIKVDDIMSVRETAPQMVSYFDNRTRAFLEIQNGCNHRCTFCIIPFGRGNSRSVLFGDIVAQTRKMVEMGHKEVVLTGVDISDYGKDLELKITLSQMIKRLLALVPELTRLRLSSIDVAEIDDGFWQLIENEPRFMPYFHLSVQSGDDMILKRMKRRHTRQQVIDFCQKARKLRPEITFGADIIAGFPTETDEMFENSLKLIEEADLIFTHIFPYSKREGTPAAKMPEINGAIVKERARLLREKGQSQLQKYLATQVGKKMKVVVENGEFAKSENFLDVKIPKKLQNSKNITEVQISGFGDGFLIAKNS